MATPWEDESWLGYYYQMIRLVHRQVARWAAPHPYLGHDDLLQEALVALFAVWRRFYGVPPGDLLRLGQQAVRWQLAKARRRARARGEGTVDWAPFDLLAEVADAPDVGFALADIALAGIYRVGGPMALEKEARMKKDVGTEQAQGTPPAVTSGFVPPDVEAALAPEERPAVKQKAAKTAQATAAKRTPTEGATMKPARKAGGKKAATPTPAAEKAKGAKAPTPAPKAKRAPTNGIGDDVKVVVGAAARPTSIRARIQGFATKPIRVADLAAKAAEIKDCKNGRGKIMHMLSTGLLKKVS